jgi:hypothetical protein
LGSLKLAGQVKFTSRDAPAGQTASNVWLSMQGKVTLTLTALAGQRFALE